MPRRAHLIRDIPVRLLDFSWSGCLLETNHPLMEGTTAELRVDMGGKQCHDLVQIVRRTTHRGSGHAFTLGGEFAWRSRPDLGSVRAELPSIVTLP